ncbi:tyrosine-specific transport protein-2 [Rodentibacter pneumotropicus]|uniref:Tyrosine-specific transport protein-2 n=1 Tax=Rodentibacter pneumotropicus TaxID=758 RepID=A0A3S4TT04_9PAST|nr:tyrosine-specific transport protein-2 [Rodentibacter pneumotropicus]
MFALYAVVLPAALVWKARKHHPNLPYRVIGGKSILIVISILGIIIVNIPFFIKLGFYQWLLANKNWHSYLECQFKFIFHS